MKMIIGDFDLVAWSILFFLGSIIALTETSWTLYGRWVVFTFCSAPLIVTLPHEIRCLRSKRKK